MEGAYRMHVMMLGGDPATQERIRSALYELQPDDTAFETYPAADTVPGPVEGVGPDLLILSLDVEQEVGHGALLSHLAAFPCVPTVVVSENARPRAARIAAKAGAAGVIPASSPRWILLGALELVLAGGVYQPPRE